MNMSRRWFATAGALASVASRRVMGANDRIRVGVIGVGNRAIHRVFVPRVPEASVTHPGHLAEIPYDVVPVRFHLIPVRHDPPAAGRTVPILTCDNRISGVY